MTETLRQTNLNKKEIFRPTLLRSSDLSPSLTTLSSGTWKVLYHDPCPSPPAWGAGEMQTQPEKSAHLQPAAGEASPQQQGSLGRGLGMTLPPLWSYLNSPKLMQLLPPYVIHCSLQRLFWITVIIQQLLAGLYSFTSFHFIPTTRL